MPAKPKRLALILASSSPRRRELLSALGYPFLVRAAHVDERRRKEEAPSRYARRLAREKALTVARDHPDAIVIGADTIVLLDGDVLGKPRSRAEAIRMLRRLSGRTHEVRTAVAVVAEGRLRTFLSRSTVRFVKIPRDEIRRYVATGEPMDKAGAYAIQGRGAAFIRGVRGSVTNVVGLPLAELAEVLSRAFLHRRGG